MIKELSFEGNFIILADSIGPLSPPDQMFKHLAIALNINNSSPLINLNNINLPVLEHFDIGLFADLKLLNLKECNLILFHTGDYPLNIWIFFAQVILQEWLLLHSVHTFCLFDRLLCGRLHVLESQSYQIVRGRLIDSLAHSDNCLVNVQQFLLVSRHNTHSPVHSFA